MGGNACLIHVGRNLAAKLPDDAAPDILAQYWACFDVDTLLVPDELGHHLDPGPDLAAVVDKRLAALAATYQATYPGFAKCLLADAEGLTAYLNLPAAHHKRIRHSNLIERTFGETRRRVKVIGRLPGQTSCLTLVYGVLSRAATGWRGLV
ncbi:MAG: transposase, partial [Actinomycetia bacterium]|nr:transposase [Actinomycetes bacterium]